MMSATCAEAVGPQQVLGGGGREGGERILALDAPRREVAHPPRADGERAVGARAHQQEADVGVGAQRRHQVGVEVVDLLQREALVPLHQVDEPQVPGAEHDRVAAAHLVARDVVGLRAPGRLADRLPDGGVVLVARLDLGHAAAGERAPHQVLEAVAVSLQEGGALGLAVIREHDDLVGAGRVPAGPVDAPELLVQLAQRLEGVGPLEARVVGDLVVRGEGRVDGGRPAIMSVSTP